MTASDPDGADGWRYRDLAHVDPLLADQLIGNYAEVWLPLAELSPDRQSKVADTVWLVVADEWEGSEPGKGVSE